ncbi:hypothetical protein HETIRDRAFT_322073 [Heterobasidion irregulare TC 32-1]|uniref:HNH nuclease domain-containing protein n=1 Tax=Heterobasidion irregulare (strain TC 32-1) TaxID=747525 RepID=W4K275_HETIT|nr:uncharacterized protein HETIRDRAFT_322073 [Heterobasidion irregulare TC 32-1]ETW79450.1 hypothetical protein HETIRDRAFT_322073 [Heterobasidion irregulare TC 32-1]
MAASIPKNIESKSSPNKKRRRARSSNPVPAGPEATEKCLVTGDSMTESPIHLCHVFHERHWSNHPMLSRLEWAWGMKYDTIQMDQDSNTISLRHDWRDLFESDRWALMPSTDIIDKLWDRWVKISLRDGNVPSIEDIYDGAEIFEYRLVPLFPDVPSISRRNKTEDILEGDEFSGTSVHSYPFDTLPPIFSRVKPHFVVCDAGRKIGLILLQSYRTTSDIARIYGVSMEKAERVMLVVYSTYCTWNDHVHPSMFVTSPRTNNARSRSGLIRPGQPNFVSQRASRPKKRCRATGEVIDAVCPQPNAVQYATCLSRVTPCGSDALIVGDSGWDTEDTEVYAEFERKQVRRAIKASKRWVRDCEREAQSSGGWISCVTDDEQVKSYRQEPARRMTSSM